MDVERSADVFGGCWGESCMEPMTLKAELLRQTGRAPLHR